MKEFVRHSRGLPPTARPAKRRPVGAGRRMSLRRYYSKPSRLTQVCYAALVVLALSVCVYVGYFHSSDSIRQASETAAAGRTDTGAYTIIYSPSDAFGETAAHLLQNRFAEKTGSSLTVLPDSEPMTLHEIRVGYTNRAGDDYLTSVSTLGTDGYAILLTPGDSVNLYAFSESGATAAVESFINTYVGAYRGGEITFATRLNLTYVSRTGTEPGTALKDSPIRLHLNAVGKFRTLLLSDADCHVCTLEAIEVLAQKETPDLVLFCGDLSSGITNRADLEAYVKTLTEPLERMGIPWAYVLGEQDTAGGLSAEQQAEVYASFAHCVAKVDLAVNGTVSYFLPIYAAGDDRETAAPVCGIWALGETPLLSLTTGTVAEEPLFASNKADGTDYGYVTAAQQAWLLENYALLNREAGGAMPTFAVCHTPVAELGQIAAHPTEAGMLGRCGEPVSASPVASGLLATLTESRYVLGLYCGHDHLNTFSGRYCGLELGYVASIGYDGYGAGGTFETNNEYRGGRIVELTVTGGEASLYSRMVYASYYGIGRE